MECYGKTCSPLLMNQAFRSLWEEGSCACCPRATEVLDKVEKDPVLGPKLGEGFLAGTPISEVLWTLVHQQEVN